MPTGQGPTQSPVNIVNSTLGLKVYFKLNPTDEWEEDKALICLSHSKTKGAKIGTATFTILTPNNDQTDVNWQEANASMRYNAAVKYRVDISAGYLTPYLVKVTDIFDGVEKQVWMGYISSVEQDHVAERVTLMAQTYAGLLDQQQIIGGWYLNIDDDVDYFIDYVPVYNPNGIGNRSTQTIYSGNYNIYGIDKTKEKDTESKSNMWTAKDMLYQVIGRLENGLYNDTGNLFNPWKWAADLYDTNFGILTITPSIEQKLDNTSAVGGYTLQGKTIWQALVEIVESVEGLTISEGLPTFDKASILLVDLKG